MKPSKSEFVPIRGLRYHCRCWGEASAPKLFLLHGWMDVSASFQFMVDAMRGSWQIIAPDWRGFGLSDWARAESYWFPDYFADLDRLLDHFAPDGAVTLIGHSMGGNIATLYAGIRPSRVAQLVNLEGFGLASTSPGQAPDRYARWLDESREEPSFREYDSFESLAARLRRDNPRLDAAKAAFLAAHWGTGRGDRVRLTSDPRHKRINPILYRDEEVAACWGRVTAPVLWVTGAESNMQERLRLPAEELRERMTRMRDVTERMIPNAGHMLHHDQPEHLAGIVEDFLR